MKFSFYAILLLINAVILISADIETTEYKFLRNKKFNDSYLDLFFKTTPSGLQSNWLYLDDNFLYKKNPYLETIPINRTKLSRKPYFAFEGIPIYQIENGQVDLSRFSLLSNLFYIEQERADSSRFPTISDFNNIISDTNLRKGSANINIGAGNQIGSFAAHFFTAKKQFKYFVSASAMNSPGVVVSNKVDKNLRSELNYLKNSDLTQGNFFGKVYFDNNISQVGINCYLVGGSKSIPPILDSSEKYQRFPLYNNLILNFDFNTKFDEGIILSGNLFYNNFYNKRSTYDDSTYKSQNFLYSINQTTYGYNYGSIVAIKTNFFDIAPTNNIAIAYIRDIYNIKANKIQSQSRYEIENLQISLRQPLFYKNLSIYPTVRYSIKKPLYPNSNNNVLSVFKGFDYRIDLNYNVKKNFILLATVSKENFMPSNTEIFHYNYNLNYEKEIYGNIGFKLHSPDYEITTKLFYSQLDDLIEYNESEKIYFNNPENIKSKGLDFNMKIFSDFGYILINYTYNDLNKLVKFPTKPKHIGEIKIYNTYSIGLRWMLEVEYFSNEYVLSENINNLGVKNLFIMNYRIGYKVFRENEIFTAIYNFLNAKYFVYDDLPGNGMNFFVGIHIHL